MVRARLASVALAGSLCLAAGCSMTSTGSGSGFGGFDLFHRSSRNAVSCPCDCDAGFSTAPCCPTAGCPTGGCAGAPLISNVHPPIVEGPALFPPSPTPLVFPGTTMPSATAPRFTVPPVTTVPHAIVTPSPP